MSVTCPKCSADLSGQPVRYCPICGELAKEAGGRGMSEDLSKGCRYWNGQCTSPHALTGKYTCKCAFWRPKTSVEILSEQCVQLVAERDAARAEVERLRKREAVLVNALLEAGAIVKDGDEWVCKLCNDVYATREGMIHNDGCPFKEGG